MVEQKKILSIPTYLINGIHPITVTLIGCGGTGSLVLSKLARLHKALNFLDHPGFYVSVYDGDFVEEYNVGRQLFTENDIGENKAICSVSKINLAFNLNWDSYPEYFRGKDIVGNIIISCVDNHKAKKDVIDSFFKKDDKYSIDINKRYFLIDCGNGRDFGQIILTDIDNKLKCFYDFFGKDISKYDTKNLQGEGCTYLDKLNEQDLFINDTISLYVVKIIKDMLFLKQLDYQGYFINTKDELVTKIDLL